MLWIMDRAVARPPCPRCGSERLAVLVPADTERTADVEAALAAGRVVIPEADAPAPAPLWRCLDCGEDVHAHRPAPPAP